ncbi:hypothetical protein ACFQPA_14350 [Halomarina halobia]|uniref:Nucleotide modification associated domain-containing protein n=1 Tax=Halomarina halobia TaxID=3033386 RepID=A0ABD6A8V2_9EURY|nr:hypothetical protein [Halomarina sp. PSR21]
MNPRETGPRAVAINVAANTNMPGVRGPVRPDGTFEYVPIPERRPTREPVPTYADLDLETEIPEAERGTPVHFDPEFPEAGGERYTYGDEHGVKARPLSELERGDYLLFYATLSQVGEPAPWQAPEWGAYLVGAFRLARAPVTGEAYRDLSREERAPFRNNAHVKRADFDARVLVLGDPDGSRLFERAVPLSGRETGTAANRIVTDLSADSGRGPWWRRPLRFDAAATDELLAILDGHAVERCF